MSALRELFPSFDKKLLDEMEHHAELRDVKAGEVLMRKGQYIKHTMLVLKGGVKIYRNDDEGGEFFMYHLHPGQACAVSMVCAAHAEVSEVTAIAIEDSTLLYVPLKRCINGWQRKKAGMNLW